MGMSNEKRQPKGIPVGGQFAASEKDEASPGVQAALLDVIQGRDVGDLSDATVIAASNPAVSHDEWLPPGAHQIVECPLCHAAEPAVLTCRYCGVDGKVTTDRYGQLPFRPDVPGTKVGFQSRRSGEDHAWVAATITASADPDRSEFYAPGLTADERGFPGARGVEVYLHSAIPLAAAQAAARHGVTKSEMIEEAAHDMSIGIDPSHDEVRAFLDRISEGYLDDLGRAAAEYKSFRAAELREDGLDGPALDTSFDTSVLKPGAVDRAIENAKSGFHSQFEVTGRDSWRGYTIVYDENRGFPQTYDDDAWTEPDEAPMLPWSPPKGTPIAHVALDGTVTRVDQK